MAWGRLMLAVGLLVGFWPANGAANGAAKEYGIPSYEVTLRLLENGSYHVTETIHYRFRQGSFTYAFRTIPTEDIRDLSLIDVRSPNTSITQAKKRFTGKEWRIRWEYPERTEPATFVLEYRVESALFEQGDRNLIDWDVVGPQWSVPVRKVAAKVRIPRHLAPGPEAIEGKPEGAVAAEYKHWEIRFSRDRVAPGDRFRIKVWLPKFMEAESTGPALGALPWILFWGFLAFLPGVYPGIRTVLRTMPGAGPPRGPVTDPPELPPGDAAVLQGGTTDGKRGYVAALFTLAQKGHLTFKHRKKGWFPVRWTKVDYELHPTEDAEHTGLESAVVQRLRGEKDLKKAGKALRPDTHLLQEARERLIQAGLLADRRSRSLTHLLKALGAAHLTGFTLLGGLVTGNLLYSLIPAGFALGLAVGWGAVAAQRYPYTAEGARARERLRSFLRGLRHNLQETARSHPDQGVQDFLCYLPWLVLDRKVRWFWMKRLSWKLARASSPTLVLPTWLETESHRTEEVSEAVKEVLIAVVQYSSGHVAGVGAGSGGAGGGGGGGGAGGGGGGAG